MFSLHILGFQTVMGNELDISSHGLLGTVAVRSGWSLSILRCHNHTHALKFKCLRGWWSVTALIWCIWNTVSSLNRSLTSFFLVVLLVETFHSTILAWEIPWTEEPSWLWSMGSQKLGHSLATKKQQSSICGSLTGVLDTHCWFCLWYFVNIIMMTEIWFSGQCDKNICTDFNEDDQVPLLHIHSSGPALSQGHLTGCKGWGQTACTTSVWQHALPKAWVLPQLKYQPEPCSQVGVSLCFFSALFFSLGNVASFYPHQQTC